MKGDLLRWTACMWQEKSHSGKIYVPSLHNPEQRLLKDKINLFGWLRHLLWDIDQENVPDMINKEIVYALNSDMNSKKQFKVWTEYKDASTNSCHCVFYIEKQYGCLQPPSVNWLQSNFDPAASISLCLTAIQQTTAWILVTWYLTLQTF